MFKIPDWEEGTPENSIKFKKIIKKRENTESQNTDKELDEILVGVKKKKLNDVIRNEDQEHDLFKETAKHKQVKTNSKKQLTKEVKRKSSNKISKRKNNSFVSSDDRKKNDDDEKINNNNFVCNAKRSKSIDKTLYKKQQLTELLNKDVHRKKLKVNGNKLRDRMLERLKAAQFRYLNEKLYTSSGSEAQKLFQSDPIAFHTYHQGYQLQVKKWPVNPLDVIVKKILKMPHTYKIADMGCGEAALSKLVPQPVRSFDLMSSAQGVETCDMAHTPLLTASIDVAVYCLALMGTDLTQYLVEANRILKTGGCLLIAEVESRFDNVDDFTKEIQKLGFKLKNLDKSHNVFFFMEFIKTCDPPVKKSKLPNLTLKPCLYKKR